MSDAFSKALTDAGSAQIFSPSASTFDAISNVVSSFNITLPAGVLGRIAPRSLFTVPPGLLDGIIPRDVFTLPPGLLDGIVPRNLLTVPPGLFDGIIPRNLFTLPPGFIDGLLPKITVQVPPGLLDGFGLLSDSLRAALRLAAESAGRHVPSNWRALEIPEGDILDQLVLEEGLPLAWVPPGNILDQLLRAPDAQARRRIIGRQSPRILASSEDAMDNITSPIGRRYRRFVVSAIHSIQAGYREAGQALATNTLDTVLSRHGLKPKSKNNRPNLESMQFRDALVIGALWRAYFSYHPEQTPPRWFGRHPTAHGVSSQQYTLRNATLAVMHLTAAIRWLELDGWRD